MKYRDREIGGVENGVVRYRFYGDEEAAKGLVRQARVLLGDFKKYVQNNANADMNYHHDFKHQDGTVIRTKTILGSNGYPDQDEIWISVPSVPVKKGGGRCLGYIVQVFSDGNSTNNASIVFELETPSKKILGLNSHSNKFLEPPYVYGGDIVFNGYPDFGAKFIDYTVNGDYPIPDHQMVYVNNYVDKHIGEGLGPIVYTKVQSLPLPTLNSGWGYVHTYSHSAGSCGEGYPWEETANPGVTTWSGEEVSVPGYPAYPPFEVTGMEMYYSGGHSLGPGGLVPPFLACNRDTPSSGVTYDELTAYQLLEVSTPIALVALNELNTWGYDYEVSLRPNSENTGYQEIASFQAPNNHIENITRRKDGNGFITNSGIKFQQGALELTYRNATEGRNALVMIASKGDKKNIKYTDAVRADNIVSNNSETQVANLGAGMFPFFQATLDPPGGSGVSGLWAGPPLTDLGSRVNWIDHHIYSQEMTGDFGIPVNVEWGVHKLTIEEWASPLNTERKVRVYLLIEDKGMLSVEFDSPDVTPVMSGSIVRWYDYTKKLHIKVGEFEEFNELVYWS